LRFETFDAAYTARLRAADAATLDHFASYFGELIQLKLRSRVESREVVEDLRQETFTRVLTALKSEAGLHHADRLGAFVNSVCNNVLFEHYRSRGRTESLELREEVHPLASEAPDALSRVVSKDEVRAVRRILAKLGDRDRGRGLRPDGSWPRVPESPPAPGQTGFQDCVRQKHGIWHSERLYGLATGRGGSGYSLSFEGLAWKEPYHNRESAIKMTRLRSFCTIPLCEL
jgi:RNA polymerase sigma-70 factor (ECF subfamily)